MASPKITKQGASFPEDPPGTPKLQPGDGGDRSARVQAARDEGLLPGEALPHARPGEEGERFRSLDNPAQDVIRRDDEQPEQPTEGETEAEVETYEGDAWTKAMLQAEASKRGVSTSGTKEELASRLREDDQQQDLD